MYDINLLKEESVISIIEEVILKKEDNPHQITVVITNKRLIFLDYPALEHNFEEDLRISRGVDYLKKKEEIYSVYLKDIKEIIEGKEYNKYNLSDSNHFYLYDEANVLKSYIENM